MSDLFTEYLKTADAKICRLPWAGGNNGKYFRCHFCGHKFKAGDKYRIIYTNDIKGAGGNPIVCEACNDTTPNLRDKWKELKAEARERFWWLRREL